MKSKPRAQPGSTNTTLEPIAPMTHRSRLAMASTNCAEQPLKVLAFPAPSISSESGNLPFVLAARRLGKAPTPASRPARTVKEAKSVPPENALLSFPSG